MPYLTKRALKGLKDYKYKPAGYTVLDDLHQPIWNYITRRFLPGWLAPNLITLTGLIALLATYVVTAYYSPDFEHELPRWIYLMSSVGVFFYLHMDALDGKQARKTGTSSPLGQLFDHGCDAFAVHLILVSLLTSLQLEFDTKAVAGVLYVFIPWWMAHWEEYHTGIMVYGSGLWGVTEANYAVCLVHLYTYFVGPIGWKYRPFVNSCMALETEGVLSRICANIFILQINDILLLTFGFMGVSLFVQQVLRVFKLSESEALLKTTLPLAERGNKSLGLLNAAIHLFQILWTCIACGTILMLPIVPPFHSRVVFAIFGITYALQATRLIMAHMTKEPFVIAIWPNLFIASLVFNAIFPFADPVILAYSVLVIITTGYLHYIFGVVSEICEFLDIHALTIKAKPE